MRSDAIHFFLDFVSTYSYFAAMRIDDIARRHGRVVKWQVVSLPHIFKLAGTMSPLDQPYKLAHNRRDTERVALQWNLPFQRIAGPPDVQLARLAFHRIRRHDQVASGHFARAAIALRFGQAIELNTMPALQLACHDAGIDPSLIDGAQADESAKADLVVATQHAVTHYGMFGAPFAVADEEPFWGHDRVTDQLDWWLRNSDTPQKKTI